LTRAGKDVGLFLTRTSLQVQDGRQLLMNIVFKVGGKREREREHKLKQRDQQKLKPKSIIHYLF
jgi:hypothetical protein